MIAIENWREDIKAGHYDEEWFPQQMSYAVPNELGSSLFTMIIILLLVLMATMLIGSERSTRKLDFTFSLPYKRRTIFFMKWLMGIVPVVVMFTITFFMSYFIILNSEFSMYLNQFNVFEAFAFQLIGFIATYSFALFIGTITGEMISQLTLTFIFTIFPVGFLALLQVFVDVNFGNVYSRILEWTEELGRLMWPAYSFYTPGYNMFQLQSIDLLFPLFATFIFLFMGQWLYERNKSEYNGEFLIFKQLEPIFKVGIIVCFALLGGMIGTGLAPWGLRESVIYILFYWIGFLVFGYLSFLFTRKLFSMNVKIKGR